MTTRNTWQAKILRMHPCDEAIEWLKDQPNAAAAWQQCQRGDWMLWLLDMLAGPPWSRSRRKLTLAVCACERFELAFVNNDAEELFATCAKIVRRYYPRAPQIGKRKS